MNKRFLPESYKQDIYNRLLSLKQNNMSVGEYMREFEQLLFRGGIHEPQEQTMARFLNGLNPLIARKVEIQTYFTLDDVCKLALKVEKRKNKSHFLRSKRVQNLHSSPSFILNPKAPHGLTRARPQLFLHQRNYLRSLRARSALNVKGMDISNVIVLTEGSWPCKRLKK